MARRYVYWDFKRRTEVLKIAIQVMDDYPDTIEKAKKRGGFNLCSVLNHCFNVAQENSCKRFVAQNAVYVVRNRSPLDHIQRRV